MINEIEYNSNDCSGTPSSTQNFCESNSFLYDKCTAICDKSNCNGISITTYSNVDCTGDILRKNNYLPEICLGADNYICSNGQIQRNVYARYNTPNIDLKAVDCSGDPIETTKYDLGCIEGTNYEYPGCDSCATFNLFCAVIIVVFFTSITF